MVRSWRRMRDWILASVLALVTAQAALADSSGARAVLEEQRHLEFSPTTYVDASGEGLAEVVKLFLKAGLDINACDPNGYGALLLAAGRGQQEIVRLLLGAGADPNLADARGRTPLMAALAARNQPVVRLLLDAGARRDPLDENGRAAIHYALAAGENWAVPLLLEEGSDYSLPTAEGETALGMAFQGKDLKLLGLLLRAQGPLLEWQTPMRHVLMRALKTNDAEMLRLLLQKHSGPPTLKDGGQPLLAYLVALKNQAAVRLMLECGADPNVRLQKPVEPEFKALIEDSRLKEYLDIETGITPLMLAASAANEGLVELLCRYGARRGAVTGKYKIAALLFAAWRSDVPSMLVLLGRNPRPEEQPSRVEISLSNQTAYYYRNGILWFQTPVSTGRSGFETPPGQYVVTDKQRSRFSSFYKVEMPFFMRLSCSEFGMHAGEVPGYPASHGCIRIPLENAIRLYKELEIGTLVRITY